MSMFINIKNNRRDLKLRLHILLKNVDNSLNRVFCPTPAPVDFNGPLGFDQSKKWLKRIDDKNSFYPLIYLIMFGTIAPLLIVPNPNWLNGMMAFFAAFATVTLFLQNRRNNNEKDEQVAQLKSENQEKTKQIERLELEIKNIKKFINMK